MTTENDQKTLEHALVVAVESELSMMESFCHPQFPCDVSTTVAMRTSRAIVAAFCRLDNSADVEKSLILAPETKLILSHAQYRLNELNQQFEARLAELPESALERQTWSA